MVARRAIESWLRRSQALELREEIARYAAGVAGSVADLDEALETAGAEFLAETEEY